MATIRAPRCPECGRPADPEHRPFCSARCRQVDLGRWLKGDYSIPGEAADPEDIAETLANRARGDGNDA